MHVATATRHNPRPLYRADINVCVLCLPIQDVATRAATNPVAIVAGKLLLPVPNMPALSVPAKLLMPSLHHTDRFFILGLGDVILPGLLAGETRKGRVFGRSSLWPVWGSVCVCVCVQW